MYYLQYLCITGRWIDYCLNANGDLWTGDYNEAMNLARYIMSETGKATRVVDYYSAMVVGYS